jgi:hypothetical protein
MHRLWQWRLVDEAGLRMERPTSPVFTSRYESEEWLGALWRVLAAQGVRVAHLEHSGVEVLPAVVLPVERMSDHEDAAERSR